MLLRARPAPPTGMDASRTATKAAKKAAKKARRLALADEAGADTATKRAAKRALDASTAAAANPDCAAASSSKRARGLGVPAPPKNTMPGSKNAASGTHDGDDSDDMDVLFGGLSAAKRAARERAEAAAEAAEAEAAEAERAKVAARRAKHKREVVRDSVFGEEYDLDRVVQPNAAMVHRFDRSSGLNVYKAHDLGLGRGGGTPLCPLYAPHGSNTAFPHASYSMLLSPQFELFVWTVTATAASEESVRPWTRKPAYLLVVSAYAGDSEPT